MSKLNYILDGREPVVCEDLLTWANSFDLNNRVVVQTWIEDVHVSTVFLAIDHNFGYGGPPVLFETMIFGGEHNLYQERYCTWDEARAGHYSACVLAAQGIQNNIGEADANN